MSEFSTGESMGESCDVFLCHNSLDKPEVRGMMFELRNRKINAWLDLHDLTPGRSWLTPILDQIRKCRSVAVCIGIHGLGTVQREELDLFVAESGKRDLPIIPVILAGVKGEPQLPVSIKQQGWVDMRIKEPDPIDRLIWGVTSKKTFRGVNEENLMGSLYDILAKSMSPGYEGIEDSLATLKGHWEARHPPGASALPEVRPPIPKPTPNPLSPLPAMAPPPVAQFGGTWRALDGSYVIIQQYGTQITAESFVNVFGVATKTAGGKGMVVGKVAHLDFMDAYGNSGRSEVLLSDDGQSFAGVARYHNGAVQNLYANRSL